MPARPYPACLFALTVVLSGGAASAAPVKPHLAVRVQRLTLYSATASLEVPPDRVEKVELQVGRRKTSSVGSEVEHRAFSRRPAKTARVKITLSDEVRDGNGVRVSSADTVLRERVEIPAIGGTRQTRGRRFGTLVYARPMFHFDAAPAGIPLEDIQKVTYAWPKGQGEQFLSRRELTADPEKPYMSSMNGYGVLHPFPLAAAVHMKDGRVLHLEAFVGPKPAASR